jgi:hypothetical protein
MRGVCLFDALPQLIEQGLRVLQDRRVEAFSEPAVDGCEEITGFRALALIAQEAGEAAGRPEFIKLRTLLLCNR